MRSRCGGTPCPLPLLVLLGCVAIAAAAGQPLATTTPVERVASVALCPPYSPGCGNAARQAGATVGDPCSAPCRELSGARLCPTTSDHTGDAGTPWGWCFKTNKTAKDIFARAEILYLVNDRNKAARVLYEEAAAKGHLASQYRLGDIHYFGYGVDKDQAAAAEWLERASSQGHAKAQFSLAVQYENGEGLRTNLPKAAELYTRAAMQGEMDAQFNLGLFYKRGDGVAKSAATGLRWLLMAAKQGDAEAQYQAATLYSAGTGGVEKNDQLALMWMQLSADGGDKDAKKLVDDYAGHCRFSTAQCRVKDVDDIVRGFKTTDPCTASGLNRTTYCSDNGDATPE